MINHKLQIMCPVAVIPNFTLSKLKLSLLFLPDPPSCWVNDLWTGVFIVLSTTSFAFVYINTDFINSILKGGQGVASFNFCCKKPVTKYL